MSLTRSRYRFIHKDGLPSKEAFTNFHEQQAESTFRLTHVSCIKLYLSCGFEFKNAELFQTFTSVPQNLQGQDFHREIGELAEDVIPQHNYRLDAKSAEGRHYGEVACREFWGSVLRVMPHRYCQWPDP